uniref:Secreted pectate lyase family protein n=1 Tax=uncultured planctomycete 3FN TaxID=455066 RepID=A9LGW4_9BACT|nr:secreted pectate lyase family protein [uncultured planctomycete 3FN]
MFVRMNCRPTQIHRCRRRITLCVVASVATCLTAASAADEISPEQAARALRKSVDFFEKQVSAEGGYLWQYSRDLDRREGEGRADARTAWVQPPGTPTVGMTLLRLYQLTEDPHYLKSARRTAGALIAGQLRSGGWDYRIVFEPKARARYAYRVDPVGKKSVRNTTTLDDNVTQAALRFLMQIDRELKFQDKAVHEAARFGLESLLKAQYPNGGWPQRYSKFPNPSDYPVRKASYPDSWSRTYAKRDYKGDYTFNDNSIADVISIMFLAADVYKDERYAAAAKKAGDFIILAQMPEPQPAWAQQYNSQMQPAWARKFEPPSITGGESQGILRTLLVLYRKTGNKKYLEPIPRALAYLKKSELPGNKLPRFLELETNRPLYFTKDYQLTYSSDDMPTHYGFIVGSSVKSIEAAYLRVLRMPAAKLDLPPKEKRYRLTPSVKERARAAVAAMDKRGAWVLQGRLKYHGPDDDTTQVIDTKTFIRHTTALAEYLSASKAAGK